MIGPRRLVRGAARRALALKHRVCAAMLGLERWPPNYAFRPNFRPGDVAIDIGTGNDPDFSKLLIRRYGVECFAVDPTRKHAGALRAPERELPGFHYLPYALAARDGTLEFYESAVNVSGSLLARHRNVVNDPVSRYPVEAVTLPALLRIVARSEIAILKIDLEGAEYEVIGSLDLALLRGIRQIMVEFHHDTVAGITRRDTLRAAARLTGAGMRALAYNGRDMLFWWPRR